MQLNQDQVEQTKNVSKHVLRNHQSKTKTRTQNSQTLIWFKLF